MPRALAVHRTEIAPAQRAGFMDRLPARRDHYRRAGCHYWVFEEAGRAGSFIEFVEAADAATVEAALAAAPDLLAGARIFHGLEID